MSRPIDIYCERVADTFWAEPVNALTNAAFILAAVALGAQRVWRNGNGLAATLSTLWLILLIAAVGIGSFLFHTVARPWAGAADVIPIILFIFSFFALAMRRLLGLPWWGAALATLAFFGFSLGFRAVTPPILNNSNGYVPALLALTLLSVFLLVRDGVQSTGARWLALAAASFLGSITFRWLDDQTGALCAQFPLGTHFLWHLLNGVVLYAAVRAITGTGETRVKPG